MLGCFVLSFSFPVVPVVAPLVVFFVVLPGDWIVWVSAIPLFWVSSILPSALGTVATLATLATVDASAGSWFRLPSWW